MHMSIQTSRGKCNSYLTRKILQKKKKHSTDKLQISMISIAKENKSTDNKYVSCITR